MKGIHPGSLLGIQTQVFNQEYQILTFPLAGVSGTLGECGNACHWFYVLFISTNYSLVSIDS